MNHKINLQARIKRHSRILKDNLGNSLSHSYKKSLGYRILSLLILLVFPFYPNFTYLVYSNTEFEFDRTSIDESSIIESFDGKEGDINDKLVFESEDSFLSVGALIDDDLNKSNKIISYVVSEGETLAGIAKEYNISEDTIIWENNFGTGHILEKGEKIKFPPVTGLSHIVKRGDTISTLAYKYSIDSKKITDQNLLKDNNITLGQKLILPGAKYIPKKVEVEPKKKNFIAKKSNTKKVYVKKKYPKKNIKGSKSVYKAGKGRYKLRWRRPFSGAPGNCTNYVASYKNVNWRGNANQWLRNARAKGHRTGKNATVGSIIVFSGRGYNPRYGHVGIVMEVHKNHLIISDMNYRRKYQVTYRKIKRWSGSIRGYIYVN